MALLKRHHCPTPFHVVRTRFLGNIASPLLDVSPMEVVKKLWGGELPEFQNMDEVNELFNALVGGLWNRLTAHQNSRHPFKLLRFEVDQTRDGLGQLAQVRNQELDGFVEGLFGSHVEIALPERAHQALGVLAEVRALFVGIVDLLNDPGIPAPPEELKKLLQNIQRMTILAETEMNKANLSCKRARSQTLATMLTAKPTLH